MMNKVLLWVDDCRDPMKDNWLDFSPIGKNCKVIWVKSYDEAIQYIKEHGLPTAICLDHDLDDERESKTGYALAKFLVEYCFDMRMPVPLFASQSANPVGRENILSYLTNATTAINKFLKNA